MIPTENLDLLALSLFLGAWIVLVARDIRERTNRADPLAVFLFMCGSIVLCVLQFSKNKVVFIIIGLIIATLSILNWFYVPHRIAKLEKEITSIGKRPKNKKSAQ